MDGASKEICIEVSGLTAGYGNLVVLEDISFKVRKGEIFVIVGGSGCGKTTLLKHMIGLIPPMRGDIRIFGESIVKADWEGKRRIMRRFGVLYQTGALFGSLTLAENVALPLEEFTDLTPPKIMERVNEKLRLVALDGFQKFMPYELSGGMRKRAGLARALALDPEILFFDEPSTSLDPITSANLDKLILGVREKLGTTMVIVTHELDSIFAVSDRVIILDKGTKGIVAEGRPYDLRDSNPDPKVREFLSRAGLSRKMKAE